MRHKTCIQEMLSNWWLLLLYILLAVGSQGLSYEHDCSHLNDGPLRQDLFYLWFQR